MPAIDQQFTEETLLSQVSQIARESGRQFVDAADADDIAQDVVLDYLVAFRDGRVTASGKDLIALVRNQVFCRIVDLDRAIRRRARRDGQFLASLADVAPAWMSPRARFEEGELTDLVTRSLDTLTPLCRTVYLMVRNDETSYLSVASALGISRSAVCGHVVVAQRRLRAALSDWLELRTATVSPLYAEPASHVGPVVDQPVDVAA
ncbi:MAG: hypothetical protein ABJE47_08890 [bacterium]